MDVPYNFMRLLHFLVFFVGLGLTILGAVPSDWAPAPIVVVSENVNVSVGPQMALVVGRYWYQYVAKLDDRVSQRIPIYYATFVPKNVTAFRDLLEVSQVKLMLGERMFLPESARILSDEETGILQIAPKDAAIAWFVFQIPRDLARLRFDVVISHFQPHYHYEGKSIAAYWPWLPQLDPLRKDLELMDKDFVVTVEALPHVRLKAESINAHLESSSPERLIVHPTHGENIAAAVEVDGATN